MGGIIGIVGLSQRLGLDWVEDDEVIVVKERARDGEVGYEQREIRGSAEDKGWLQRGEENSSPRFWCPR